MRKSFVALLSLAYAAAAGAQQAPAMRPLGAVVATSKAEFGPMVSMRHLKNGSVLVNDVQNRRVVMLDSTLTSMTVIADTTPATANAYSGRTAGLIAYRGDSTLFVDPQSLTMLVIDPQGNVGRTMALPRSQDAMMLGNSVLGGASYDGKGIVYRTMNFAGMMRMRGAAGGPPQPPQMPDSTPIVRVDLATRLVDTLAQIRIPSMKLDMQRDENGRVSINTIMNPLPTVDDWAVLADGSIALLRGRDYHVDFIRPDGTRESGGKIPFEWRRLSDEDKVAFMDSVKAQRERMMAQMTAHDSARGRAEGGARTMAAGPGGGPGGQGGPGGDRMTITMGAGGGGGPAGGAVMMGGRNMQFIPPDELPDYQPVFFANAARADEDGNLWVRTTPTKALPGGFVYDVIDAKGTLIERIQIPANRQVVGFGRGGIVYLAPLAGTARMIERAAIR
jgi:hypothetical protein